MFKIWRCLTPFASDNVGAASVFANTRGLMIFHDMNGSIACAERFLNLGRTPCFYCASLLGIHDKDYVLGDTSRFIEQYIEIVQACNPEFVVLIDGPISSLTGLDLDLLAAELSDRVDMPVIAVRSSLDKDYVQGISASFESIYKTLKADIRMKRGEYEAAKAMDGPLAGFGKLKLGLLGLDLYDFAGMRNCQTLLSLFHCAWGCAPSLEDHSRIGEVDKSVVMSSAAYKIAKKMKSKLGIDYVLLDECDDVRRVVPHIRDMRCRISDTLAELLPKRRPMLWGEEQEGPLSLRFLIVGDQVVAHAAAKEIRELLEERRSPFSREIEADFDFALPFGMIEEVALDNDFLVDSEDELMDAINCEEYDFVVAPSCLGPFSSARNFVTLENWAMRSE